MSIKKIALVTDTHLQEEMPFLSNKEAQQHFDVVLSHIADNAITDIIFCGDIGSKNSHDSFFNALQNYSWHIVLGNHDSMADLADRLHGSQVSEEWYYYFDEQGFRYIIMDSSKGNVSRKQLDWLKNIVEDSRFPLLIFIHHPLLKIETTVDTLYFLENRMDIVHILEKAPTYCTVFCGHYHMNDEQLSGNIRQITTSAVSYQIQKDAVGVQIDTSTYGYRILEVFDHSVLTHIVKFKSDESD